MKTMVSLELIKMRRRYFFLPIILFVGIGLLWCTVIALKEFSVSSDNKSIWLLINDLVIVNSMILPLLIGVMCSRLIEIEHRGKTFRVLQTSNQNIQELFYAKSLVAISIIIVLGVIQAAYLIFVSSTNHLVFDFNLIIKFFISYFVASLFLVELHSALSLFIEKQSVGIFLAIVGSFIGLVSGGMLPNFVKLLLPWQYYALLNPVNRVIINKKYIYQSNQYYLIFIVVVIALIIVELILIKKRLREMELC